MIQPKVEILSSQEEKMTTKYEGEMIMPQNLIYSQLVSQQTVNNCNKNV